MSILLISCNNDKEIVDSYTRRILKINLLSASDNVDTYYLNSLGDSLRIILSDLNTLKLQQPNKDILTNLIDSVSENIHVARVTNCIKGNKYKRTSVYKDKELMEAGGKDNFILDMLSTGKLTETVIIKNNSECEIIYQIDDIVGVFNAAFLLGTGTDIRNKRSNETYKYIGNNEFQISNGWILKVINPQNCEVELLTDSEIKNEQNTKPDDSSENAKVTEEQKAAEEKKKRDIAILNEFPACVRNAGTLMGTDTDNPYIKPDENSTYKYYIFYKNGVLVAPSHNRRGTYTCNEFGSIVLNLNQSVQSAESPATPVAPTQVQEPEQKPPLKSRKCVGTYTLGCLNVNAIGQVQRCLNLTSSRYPRGSGFYDYELDDKLKALGYSNGFTDADISKICSRNTAPENQVQEKDSIYNTNNP